MNSINNLSYFSELNNKQKEKVEGITSHYRCKNGDTIFLQGEFCQNWIIITSGSFIHRIKDGNSINETILYPGDSFDFINILKNSVTSGTLEAVGDSGFSVVDILGLKRISRKNPFLVSLIKESLNQEEGEVFDSSINNRGTLRHRNLRIFRSFTSILLTHIVYILPLFLLLPFKPYLGGVYFILWFSLLILRFIYSRFTFIEVSRESVSKKSLVLPRMVIGDISSPLEKVYGSTISFKNRLLKIFDIGDIRIETISGEIAIEGVRKPSRELDLFTTFKDSREGVNKAIDLTSFRNLYSKKNGLFFIESQLEADKNSEYRFKKSFIVLFFKILPPLSIFIALSILGYFMTGSELSFLFSILPILYGLYETWDWVNDRYEFKGSRVIDIEKKPLWGKEKRKEADIVSIQSISKVQKNIFEFIFNYGTIEVETLTDKFIYPYISNPDKVVENLYLVKEYYHSVKESQEKLERQEEFLNYSNYLQELTK